MEPMALGSPIGSPAGTPSSPTTSPFLPSFLMGDTAPNVSTPRSNVRQQTPRHVTFSSSNFTMPPTHLSTLPQQIGNSKSLQSVTSPPEKTNSDFGPPTLGLFDTLSPLHGSVVSSHNNSTSFLCQSGMASSAPTSQPTVMTSPGTSIGQDTTHLTQDTLLFGSCSESQKVRQSYHGAKDAPAVGGEGGWDASTWVTVFGFVPHAVNDVLAHFVHCGTILEHRWGVVGGGVGTGEDGLPCIKCNWMHLKFRTAREARRALGKNGKVFGGCMMVGVIPCQDVEILCGQKENVAQGPEVNFPSHQRSPDGALSGIRPLGVDLSSSWKESPKARSSNRGSSENAAIRPLMKTPSSPQNELQSIGSIKNSGLLSKTIDFLFGQ